MNAGTLNETGAVGRGKQNSPDNIRAIEYGASTNYLAARIKCNHPDIYQRMIEGEYKSVRTAAIDAGIVWRPTPLEKAKKIWLKMTDEERTLFQQWLSEQ